MHYHITMDDGSKTDIGADNAGEAMFLAMHQHRGQKVAECFLGTDKANLGIIRFDIPAHNPLALVLDQGEQRMCAKYLAPGHSVKLGDEWVKIDSIEDRPATVLIKYLGGAEKRLSKQTMVDVNIPITSPIPLTEVFA